jgi:hypothetical protein
MASAEVAAARVVLHGGATHTFVFTDGDYGQFRMPLEAFDAIRAIPRGEIERLELFHTHPVVTPLSSKDAHVYQQLAGSFGGDDRTIESYAIGSDRAGKPTVIFRAVLDETARHPFGIERPEPTASPPRAPVP